MKKFNLLAIAMLAGAVYLPQAFADETETGQYGGSPTLVSGTNTSTDLAGLTGSFVEGFQFKLTSTTIIQASGSASVVDLFGLSGTVLTGWALESESTSTSIAHGTITPDASGNTAFNSGNWTLTAGTYELDYIGHVVGSSSSSYSGNIAALAVPEPEQFSLFLLGLPLVSWLVRRKQAA